MERAAPLSPIRRPGRRPSSQSTGTEAPGLMRSMKYEASFLPGRRRCSGAGSASRSARIATPATSSPRCAFCTRGVHFALENNGWNCTFECEVRVSASGSARRGRSPARGAPPGDPRRRKLSKSVAKAPIAPECTERIVDIPRFCSTPIPPRDAFATDLDTPPSRSVPGAPPVSSHARPPPSPRRSWPMDYRSRRERRNISSSSHGPFSPGAVPRGRGGSSGQGRRRDRRVTREIVGWVPRSPLNPRARLLEVRARGLSDVLAG